MPIELTDGARDEIIDAASRAQKRQERRTYRAILVGFAIAALILLLFGIWATFRIETLIDDVNEAIAVNREATLANRQLAERQDERLAEILRNQRELIIAQEVSTQRILRIEGRERAAFERRVTALLTRIATELESMPALGGVSRTLRGFG